MPMKPLPKPIFKLQNGSDGYAYQEVQIIQKQAYEDGLRDAAKLCDGAKPIGGRAWSTDQAACFECLTHVESAILAMLKASKKEPQ